MRSSSRSSSKLFLNAARTLTPGGSNSCVKGRNLSVDKAMMPSTLITDGGTLKGSVGAARSCRECEGLEISCRKYGVII